MRLFQNYLHFWGFPEGVKSISVSASDFYCTFLTCLGFMWQCREQLGTMLLIGFHLNAFKVRGLLTNIDSNRSNANDMLHNIQCIYSSIQRALFNMKRSMFLDWVSLQMSHRLACALI